MRTITDHHDGHGLAEKLEITADDRNEEHGGASHFYLIEIEGAGEVGRIQFQQGPRNMAGSLPGCLDSVLLAIVIDRMRGFNQGSLPARENALVMTKCQEALHWLKHRADERANRGVLGKNEK